MSDISKNPFHFFIPLSAKRPRARPMSTVTSSLLLFHFCFSSLLPSAALPFTPSLFSFAMISVVEYFLCLYYVLFNGRFAAGWFFGCVQFICLYLYTFVCPLCLCVPAWIGLKDRRVVVRVGYLYMDGSPFCSLSSLSLSSFLSVLVSLLSSLLQHLPHLTNKLFFSISLLPPSPFLFSFPFFLPFSFFFFVSVPIARPVWPFVTRFS